MTRDPLEMLGAQTFEKKLKELQLDNMLTHLFHTAVEIATLCYA